MNRKQIATSHDGQYTYWLDSSDRYVYQRKEETGAWCGWLCSEVAWERSFSLAAELGDYSEYAPAEEKAARLKSRGWSLQIDRLASDKWRLYGFAPDAAALATVPCAIPFYQMTA